MARALDAKPISPPSEGFDMVAMTRTTNPHPSLAQGTNPVGLVDGADVGGSPGAALGTGSNVDIYTPGIEAV